MADKKFSELPAATSIAADDVFALETAAGVSKKIAGSAVGGSQTQTATVTSDPNTFEGSHLFDIAPVSFAIAYLTVTVVALDGDGETWGSNPGEISVYFPLDTDLSEISPDGITYRDWEIIMWGGPGQRILNGVGQDEWIMGLILRFVLQGFFIVDSGDDPLIIYAGANNPTATIQMDLTYR